MKVMAVTAIVVGFALLRGASASDADFPHLSMHNNAFKTTEQEQGFAHAAELDWDGLTDAEQKRCVALETAPKLDWNSVALTADNAMFFAPAMSYERLSICTGMAIQKHAQSGN